MKDLTDCELIEKCLNGQKEYFEEILSRYKNLIYSIVFKFLNSNDYANDLSQEIFIKIYRNLDKYSPKFKFSTWITKIATNHTIDYIRKKKYEIVAIEEIDYKLIENSNPEIDFIKSEQIEELNGLIKKLPEIYSVPLILYHKHGYSYQEISTIINEPLSKVKNRIFRARKLLKEELLKLEEGENFGLQQS